MGMLLCMDFLLCVAPGRRLGAAPGSGAPALAETPCSGSGDRGDHALGQDLEPLGALELPMGAGQGRRYGRGWPIHRVHRDLGAPPRHTCDLVVVAEARTRCEQQVHAWVQVTRPAPRTRSQLARGAIANRRWGRLPAERDVLANGPGLACHVDACHGFPPVCVWTRGGGPTQNAPPQGHRTMNLCPRGGTRRNVLRIGEPECPTPELRGSSIPSRTATRLATGTREGLYQPLGQGASARTRTLREPEPLSGVIYSPQTGASTRRNPAPGKNAGTPCDSAAGGDPRRLLRGAQRWTALPISPPAPQ